MTSGERRHTPRHVPAAGAPQAYIRLRTGPVLSVVDISNSGALIEGGVRLLPGTRLDAHVVTRTGRVLARSRVVRAFVWALSGASVRYRAALSFEASIDASPSGYSVPGTAAAAESGAGNTYPLSSSGAAVCP